MKKATRLYCASWVRDIGPDLRPNDYAKDNEANGEAKTTSSAQEKEPSVVEDLGQFYSLSLSNWGIYGLVFNLLFKWNGCGCNHIVWYTADLCIYCFRSIGFGKLRGLFFLLIWKVAFIFYGKCLLANMSFCL